MGLVYSQQINPGVEITVNRIRPCYIPRYRAYTTWGIVILGGGALSWFSRTQETTSSRTTELEYVALSEIAREVLFLCQVRAFIKSVVDDTIVTKEKETVTTTVNRQRTKEIHHRQATYNSRC